MGRSAWSWSSNGRATASVTGLALDGSTVTNDLVLHAISPWTPWNPKAQLESSAQLESQSSIGIFGGKRADICAACRASLAPRSGHIRGES